MSKEKSKVISITTAWDDGSSLTYAPSEWDSDVSRLLVTSMMKEVIPVQMMYDEDWEAFWKYILERGRLDDEPCDIKCDWVEKLTSWRREWEKNNATGINEH